MSRTKLWSVTDKYDTYMEVVWVDTGLWEVLIRDSATDATGVAILDTDNLWHLVRALESELKVAHKYEGAKKAEVTNDSVNHPSHYTAYKGVEVIDLTEQMNFNKGNAVKYICRAGLKSPETELEDLHKARWYIDREIDRILKGKEL